MGLFRQKELEWVDVSSSRGSSQSRDQSSSPELQADSLPAEPSGKPQSLAELFKIDIPGLNSGSIMSEPGAVQSEICSF